MCVYVYVLIFTFSSSLTAICFGVKCSQENKHSFSIPNLFYNTIELLKLHN